MSLEDNAWKAAPSYFIPLGGQILEAEKTYYPTIDSAWIQVIHNGHEIAFKLRWDDPTVDPVLKTLTEVQKSPPPPLPAEFQTDPGEKPEKPAEEPKPQKYPDAIAIQFPAGNSENGSLPYFLNGDKDHPVNIWKWVSGSNMVRELHALGLQRQSEHPSTSQQVQSKVTFKYGRYQLIMKRKLVTDDKDKDIQFKTGSTFPIALNAWDGNVNEFQTEKAISSWYHITLE